MGRVKYRLDILLYYGCRKSCVRFSVSANLTLRDYRFFQIGNKENSIFYDI